jgi:hypothetical protein
MMQIMSRVERVLGVAIPVRRFFELPTIHALAGHIAVRCSAESVQPAASLMTGEAGVSAPSVDASEGEEIEI